MISAKRIFDIIGASLALIITTPLILIIGMLIKIDSKGPIFFRQTRVGKNGQKFKIIKFRTMEPKKRLENKLITDKKDPRITQVGRWLRKGKLDELPQLINVLKGEMSIVGPRPEVPKYVKLYNKKQKKVLSVKPGMTGPAIPEYADEEEKLANKKNWEHYYVNEIMPKKLKLDLNYIENQSIFLDLKIILKTLKKCL